MDYAVNILVISVLTLLVIVKSDRICTVSGNKTGVGVHSRKVFVFLKVETDLNSVARLLEPSAVYHHQKITSLVHVFEARNSHGDQKAVISDLTKNEDLNRMGIKFEEDRQHVFVKHPVRPEEFEALSYTKSAVSAFGVKFEEDRQHVSAKHPVQPEEFEAVSYTKSEVSPFLKSATYSQMGVEHVWSKGVTGNGVTVVINDVGVNEDIPDLKKNMLKNLSYNFVLNNNDVSPEPFDQERYCGEQNDHGNNCAGVIAAEDNELCGTGISYNAKFIAVKSFELNSEHGQCRLENLDSWSAGALTHALDVADIYSNSWGSEVDFIPASQGVASAIQRGITEGRRGKGAIYVFPVSKIADPFANNMHTIAVNGIGNKHNEDGLAEICACTLTSAYGESKDGSRRYLFTTSNNGGHCTLEFKGVSASVAIVAGIVALALETNKHLGWREVQHIIVHSSEHDAFEKTGEFRRNGAGRYYHRRFGFGLLNATKLIENASKMKSLPEQLRVEAVVDRYGQHANISCSKACVNSTEHVVVLIDIHPHAQDAINVLLDSPSHTRSILVHKGKASKSYQKGIKFLSVNFWGEKSEGTWNLKAKLVGKQEIRAVFIRGLTIYGTGYTVQPASVPTAAADIDSKTHLRASKSRPHADRKNDKNEGSGNPYKGPQSSTSWSSIFLICLIIIVFAIFFAWRASKISQ